MADMENRDLSRCFPRRFGEPYTTADGATVVPVIRQPRPGQADGDALGVFVVHGGQVVWSPVVDADRIALIGVITGLVAATLGSLAVLRRPPWPVLTIRR
jgi:hypothetical protein